MAGLNRAYSLLQIKSIDEDSRVIEGIATTPAPDLIGDIIEPEGAVFTLPIPLLRAHDSGQPIGEVFYAKVSAAGIQIKARLVKVAEEGRLKERLDEAWQELKVGLVKGLSIGFNSIESSRIDNTWSTHFHKWKWLELSTCVIACNEEATITSIKSADHVVLAALGLARNKTVNVKDFAPSSSRQKSPGASGTSLKPTHKGTKMTHAEMIAALEAKRAAAMAQMEALMTKSGDAGTTMDEADATAYEDLETEVEAIDADLKRRRKHAALQVDSATVIGKGAGADHAAASAARGGRSVDRPGAGIIAVSDNLKDGRLFARFAQAMIRAKGNLSEAVSVIERDPIWMKSTPHLAQIMKAAVNAGDTTTAGWASELAYAENMATEFIEYLRPMTILGKFGQNGIPDFRRVPFNIRVGGLSGSSTAFWVGQGKPIPMSRGTTTSASLGIAKAAGLCAIDDELARLSTPSAETLVRDMLAETIIQFLDLQFIDPNNGGQTNISPASMTYGVTPTTPSAATYAGLRTDLQSMMETPLDAYLDISQAVWIMSASTALKLSMMVNALDQKVNPDLTVKGGTFMGLPAIVSQAAQIAGSPQYSDIIILLHPQQIFLADDGQVSIETSTQASIEMLDNPTNQSTATATATSMVSMFQTNSMAIKAVRYINWAKKRSTAAQWISAAAYV